LARRAISALSPTTSVAMTRSVRVAGRAAFVMTLTPRRP